jgi:NAD+ synthase (glutamine-hydrolysing)
MQRPPFYSIYAHGFARAAVCIPHVRVADPNFNAEQTVGLARRASELGAAVALFPELGISAYSNDDLFHQDVLLDVTKDALARVIAESRDLSPVILVGAPLRFEGKLFNCALVIYRGLLLGIVPKTFLPNYREFYEKRVQLGPECCETRSILSWAHGALRQRPHF